MHIPSRRPAPHLLRCPWAPRSPTPRATWVFLGFPAGLCHGQVRRGGRESVSSLRVPNLGQVVVGRVPWEDFEVGCCQRMFIKECPKDPLLW